MNQKPLYLSKADHATSTKLNDQFGIGDNILVGQRKYTQSTLKDCQVLQDFKLQVLY